MNVVVSAVGRFHAFHLAAQLAQRGFLKHFYTASFVSADIQKIPPKYVANNYLLQWGGWLYEKSRLNRFFMPSNYYVLTDNYFDRWVARRLQGPIDIFTVWAHYGLSSIPVAKQLGARVVLECGSTHILAQEKTLAEEYERWGLLYPPISPENREKILQEYRLADYIAIPALHVEKSFIKNGVPGAKLIKVPYGTNLTLFKPKTNYDKKKFKVLFVGLVGLRKGLPYLLKAWEKCGFPPESAELHIVGAMQNDATETFLKKYTAPKNVIFTGPLAQEKVRELYQLADLFVLPSLEEGIAMVQAEAMASGVPVLSTPSSGAEDLFTDGVEGFIVPARSVDTLTGKMLWSYEHRESLFEMGRLAATRAQQYSWDAYGERIVHAYQTLLKG